MSMHPESPYDFVKLGKQIADLLERAAEDHVTEAQNLLASTKALAEGIRSQLDAQTKLLEDTKARLKSFGGSVVEAHKKFLNGGSHENPTP
jgi:HD superfamily phosphodiesterase